MLRERKNKMVVGATLGNSCKVHKVECRFHVLFFLNISVFIWLHCVLVVSCEIFHWSTWTPQLWPVDSAVAQGLSCSVARGILVHSIARQVLSHWATREIQIPCSLRTNGQREFGGGGGVGLGWGCSAAHRVKTIPEWERNEGPKQYIQWEQAQAGGGLSLIFSPPVFHCVQVPSPLPASFFFFFF